MANGALAKLRRGLIFLLFLTLLSCFVFWRSGMVKLNSYVMKNDSIRYLSELTFDNNASTTCLTELLSSFGIKSVNLSVPTYVRLEQPAHISQSCKRLFPNSTSPPPKYVESKKLSEQQQQKIHSIVQHLITNFTQRNLELFMVGGSLLGSVRHFGFFPWDADIDVMIQEHQKPAVRNLLIDLSSSDDFDFVADSERRFAHMQLGILCKVDGKKKARQLYGKKKLYPVKDCPTIVDFFFGFKDKRLYRRPLEAPRSFPIDDVYPLRLRPYGPYLIPAPRKPANFLSAVYGKDFESRCDMKYFSKSYKCADLRSLHPFVTHLQLPYSCGILHVDVLVHKERMLSLFIPETLCAHLTFPNPY